MTSAITALVVASITYLGRVARGKKMSIDVVVGIGGLAIMLAAIEEADKELAKKFGLLIVIGTLLAHWQVIVKSAGFTASGIKPVKPTIKPPSSGFKGGTAGGGSGNGGGGSW